MFDHAYSPLFWDSFEASYFRQPNVFLFDLKFDLRRFFNRASCCFNASCWRRAKDSVSTDEKACLVALGSVFEGSMHNLSLI